MKPEAHRMKLEAHSKISKRLPTPNLVDVGFVVQPVRQ